MSIAESRKPLVKQATQNMEAYNLYLKALSYKRQMTPDGNKKAIELLKQAIELEPRFDLAMGELAICYVFGAIRYQFNSKDCLAWGKEMAEKALCFNQDSAEAYAALAVANFYNEATKASPEILPQILKAIELKPNDAEIHYYYSTYLMLTGDIDGAITQMEEARELDPLSIPINIELGYLYYFRGDNDLANKYFDVVLELNPNARAAVEGKGWVCITTGDFDKGIEYFLKYRDLTGDPLKGACILGFAYARSGQKQKAEECLEQVKQRASRDKDMTFTNDFCVIYLGLDDKENAMKYIRQSINENPVQLQYVKRHPELKKIWNDPDYKKLFNEIGIPLYKPKMSY